MYNDDDREEPMNINANFYKLKRIIENECFCSFEIFRENYGYSLNRLLDDIECLNDRQLRDFANNYV